MSNENPPQMTWESMVKQYVYNATTCIGGGGMTQTERVEEVINTLTEYLRPKIKEMPSPSLPT